MISELLTTNTPDMFYNDRVKNGKTKKTLMECNKVLEEGL